ncbi:M23 family metallopeptidase [Parasphingorhabdus sp. DH2-15]|uniref:M23 family metallopeptidase n=1 Tax=Parasphingorhabdus sp. DH2-15 TaxID=3444112 RepID=UPI003F686714
MKSTQRIHNVYARLVEVFPEREFFMRSNGRVKFLKISSKLQITVVMVLSALAFIWLAITVTMAVGQATVSMDKVALDEQKAQIATSEERIAKYRKSISDVASDLENRQDQIEDITGQYFPKLGDKDALLQEAAPADAKETLSKISAQIPEAQALAAIEARQLAFVVLLTKEADKRAVAAENAIRKMGLNPDIIARSFGPAQGGPFLPFLGGSQDDAEDSQIDPRFELLGRKLARMDALERGLAGIPSANPADMDDISSSFGYRRDPITGRGAMHSGLDFRGSHRQPIYAAAPGVVAFSGWKSGYGRTVEIDHGNGLMTRYAHLAVLKTREGQKVIAGQHIAGMGSSGRSTGTHLHFEVRLNNRAINPKPFLEANRDVLTIQADVKQRTRPSN